VEIEKLSANMPASCYSDNREWNMARTKKSNLNSVKKPEAEDAPMMGGVYTPIAKADPKKELKAPVKPKTTKKQTMMEPDPKEDSKDPMKDDGKKLDDLRKKAKAGDRAAKRKLMVELLFPSE
jgi:hypothetical protein